MTRKSINTEIEYIETNRQAEAMSNYLADLQSDSPSVPLPSRFSEPKWRAIYVSNAQERLNELDEAIRLYETHKPSEKAVFALTQPK